MKRVFLLTVVLALGIVGSSILVEIWSKGSVGSIYAENASLLFFIDWNSKFYEFYSFTKSFPYMIIRKTGHFVLYGILTSIFFVCLPLKEVWKKGLLAFFSATLIGLIGEVHQGFLVERSGRILDVFVDAAGSLSAVLILALLTSFSKMNKKQNEALHR